MRQLLRICSTVITIAAAGCDAVAPTVPPPSLTAVLVLYNRPARPGEGFQARAYAVDSDTVYTEVTEVAQWASSDTTVATVSSSNFVGGRGVAPVGPGTAMITAVYQGITGFLPVRVPLRFSPSSTTGSVRLNPLSGAPDLVGVGQRLQFTASVFANQRTTDVTGIAEWISSDPSVASVERGTVTSRAVGTTEIIVSHEGTSDSYMVSVRPWRSGR